MGAELPRLLRKVRSCTICASHLAAGPRPVVQVDAAARILIAGQAPGRKVHETGVPFDDPSGERLRDWMGLEHEAFYDATLVAILPMGFCYPGSGRSGDLPPRPECAPEWRSRLLAHLPRVALTLVIGRYAQAWHLERSGTVTELVGAWREYWPEALPLPHPSPRNRIWVLRNPWFEEEVIPALRAKVAELAERSFEATPTRSLPRGVRRARRPSANIRPVPSTPKPWIDR